MRRVEPPGITSVADPEVIEDGGSLARVPQGGGPLRYLFALICPPMALLLCHRGWQASFALILCLLGLASVRWGVGILVLFGCILWAVNAVGDDRAAAVSARFVWTVKPIRTIRG